MADLTLGQVLQRLYDVHQLLGQAQQQLTRARDDEVRKSHALTVAYAKAMISAPAVERGGLTVGQRDAHVDQAVESERFEVRVAEAVRKSAEDHLRVCRDQASVVQSLSALMRAEMALTGTPGST